MHCEGKLKLRPHNTSYFLIEAVTKACLTVYSNNQQCTLLRGTVVVVIVW